MTIEHAAAAEGGSYIRNSDGSLTLVSRTKPADTPADSAVKAMATPEPQTEPASNTAAPPAPAQPRTKQET